MPKTAGWNIGIQILRGLAATAVVFHHSLEESLAISTMVAPEWLIRFGACGVDIFFVISGFIIYSVTYGRESRYPDQAPLFLLKRFMRIFPLYWICLLGTLALWFSGYFYRSLHLDASILESSVFLLPSRKLVIDVAWTLVYEMYFYYLFAITLNLRNARISVFTTTGLICAGLALSKILPAGALKEFLSNPIALEFCFGLFLADFIHTRVCEWGWLRYMWMPGVLLMAVAAGFAANNRTTAGLAPNVRFLAWGLPALLVTVSFIKSEFQQTLWKRMLLPIGDASYSIYLTHPTMMIVFASLIKLHVLKGFAHPIILPFLFVVICLVFGILTHCIIERPILSWLRGFLGNRNRKEVQPLAKANRSVSIKASSTSEPAASTKPAS